MYVSPRRGRRGPGNAHQGPDQDDLRLAELDWITALRGPAIRALISQGAIQPTLFDQADMAEIPPRATRVSG